MDNIKEELDDLIAELEAISNIMEFDVEKGMDELEQQAGSIQTMLDQRRGS